MCSCRWDKLRRAYSSSAARQADDCGYESDPESFSPHVARHVAKVHIDPKLANDGQMLVCEAPRSGDARPTGLRVPGSSVSGRCQTDCRPTPSPPLNMRTSRSW